VLADMLVPELAVFLSSALTLRVGLIVILSFFPWEGALALSIAVPLPLFEMAGR
jgi:hypothetical protein